MTFLLIASLAGCAPQDAEVNGQWFAWLAQGSSANIDEDSLNISSATHFECSGRGWDPEICDFEPGYVGPENGWDDSGKYIGGDCPRTNSSGNFNAEEGPCDGDYTSACDEEDLDKFSEECDSLRSLTYHDYMTNPDSIDGYYGLTGTIEPWRSEALINSEGDLQLTVHTYLNKADDENYDQEDFRFHFSIDPDFDPIECVEDDEGNIMSRSIDESNRVDEWSEDEDGYRIFYLNAGAYQVDPNNSETSWYLSNDMNSGFGFAKFAAEEMYSRPGDYGQYQIDGTGDSFLGIVDHLNPDVIAYAERADELRASAGAGAEVDCEKDWAEYTWAEQVTCALGADAGGYQFEHKVEDNQWRPIDGTITGLDGWMEVHSSWVKIKNGQTIAQGEEVVGEFQILYEGAESGSRVLIRGDFKTTDLKEDKWGYEILEDAKREENNTPFCGGN